MKVRFCSLCLNFILSAIADRLRPCNRHQLFSGLPLVSVIRGKVSFLLLVILPGITGFQLHVDENGDVEFNMTLLEYFKNAGGGHGKKN